jgi:uncharacterized membrane protein YfhO
VDGALVGVPLPEGKHSVVLSYFPAGLKLGLALTGLSIVLIMAITALEYRLIRRGRATA